MKALITVTGIKQMKINGDRLLLIKITDPNEKKSFLFPVILFAFSKAKHVLLVLTC